MRRSVRVWVGGFLSVGLLAAPSVATAEPSPFGNGSTWSVPLRYSAQLTPELSGGVIANTAFASGGVPPEGDTLVGITASGNVDWRVPYHHQDIVSTAPVVDNAGNHYWVYQPSGGVEWDVVASKGATENWSHPITDNADHHLAVGTNGQLYDFANHSLSGYASENGEALFPPVSLPEFT